MADQRLDVKTVGVIGAGVSGVASAIHLRKAGLDVTVFERNPHVGGVWYDEPCLSMRHQSPSPMTNNTT